MKSYPETHQKGILTVDSVSINIARDKGFIAGSVIGVPNTFVGDVGVQISEDGRIWICLNGESLLRFKPLSDEMIKMLEDKN